MENSKFKELEEMLERVWCVQKFEQNDAGVITFCLVDYSDRGENLVIEGEEENFESFKQLIEYEYEDADSNEMFDCFWQVRGTRGYHEDYRDIVLDLRSRKRKYGELRNVVRKFKEEE